MQLALWAANTYLLALSFSTGLLSVLPVCTPIWNCPDATPCTWPYIRLLWAHSWSLSRSLWVAPLPFILSTALLNLVSSANLVRAHSIPLSSSLINMFKSGDPKTDPRETPVITGFHLDIKLLTTTVNLLLIFSSVQLWRFRYMKTVTDIKFENDPKTNCFFHGMLILLPLWRVEISTCPVYNHVVPNFSCHSTRNPLCVRRIRWDILLQQASTDRQPDAYLQDDFPFPTDTEVSQMTNLG